MKLAFFYAGQGSQKVGMGKDFYEQFPMVRSSFDNGSAGFDIRTLCFDTPLEVLSRTSYTQPCMAALATAVTKLLYEEGSTQPARPAFPSANTRPYMPPASLTRIRDQPPCVSR
jgi:[acyl-carrier-protein] S-malonyltransferase